MKRLAAVLAAVLSVAGLAACTDDSASAAGRCGFSFTSANKPGRVISAGERKVCDFTADLIDGGAYALKQQAGKVVVASFWASWCGPCKAEMPQFQLMYASPENQKQGVTFVGMDTKDDKGPARAFLKRNKITFPVVFDAGAKVALRLGNLPAQALPFTVVFDKQSRIAAVYTGAQSPKDLQPALNKLAGEA
jgi:peroxiredoxin